MEVGISISSTSFGRGADGATAMVERAVAAHRAGLATMSVGDNHAVSGANYHQNTPMLGAMLAEWPRRPAGCLFLLPLWSPVIVAEQVASLAAIHDAPFIVQTGIGQPYEQYGGMGRGRGGRGLLTDEAIVVIKALLAGETVTSELFDLRDVSMGLRPEVAVDWWIGAGAPVGIERAARRGDAWYASPQPTAAELAEPLARYRDACDRLDKPARVMLRRDVLVLDDATEAERHAKQILDRGYRGMDRSRVVVGDPDSVLGELAAFDELGVDQIVMRCMSASQRVALETIEAMGVVNRRL